MSGELKHCLPNCSNSSSNKYHSKDSNECIFNCSSGFFRKEGDERICIDKCEGDWPFATENAEQDGMRECLADCEYYKYDEIILANRCVSNCTWVTDNGYYEIE